MELRKDPITRSWVVIREDAIAEPASQPCPYCPGNEHLTPKALLVLPESADPWQVRVFPRFDPLFRIEGEAARAGDGLYDRMRAVGADEVVVELPQHGQRLSEAAEPEIVRVLEAYALRLNDLKKDERFKYISVFKNSVASAGQGSFHSCGQVVATPFVPRRVLHELRSAREYFQLKERCLFCDILRQELRQKTRVVEASDHYVVVCPFASRAPYEVWLLPRRHRHSFEDDYAQSKTRSELARLLRRTLQRVESVAEGYHLAVHTAPNTVADLGRVGYWKSLQDDFHWHIEIMPFIQRRLRPALTKEVYLTDVAPETAAARLRAAALSG